MSAPPQPPYNNCPRCAASGCGACDDYPRCQIDADFAFAKDIRDFRALVDASSIGEPDPDPQIERARQWLRKHPPGARLPEELEP